MDPTVGVLVFDGAEELDFAGPWEVFAMAAAEAGAGRVIAIAQTADPIRSAKGLRVVPDCAIADAPALDVLVVPGGRGTRREVSNGALLDWIRDVAAGCRWVTSVCTGSYLLHAAGIARGKRVTTHWAFVDTLRTQGEVEVVDGPRFVRDGNLVTAAGVSAGIDMALWVVGQLYSVDHARRVQRQIQYDPAPPYTADT